MVQPKQAEKTERCNTQTKSAKHIPRTIRSQIRQNGRASEELPRLITGSRDGQRSRSRERNENDQHLGKNTRTTEVPRPRKLRSKWWDNRRVCRTGTKPSEERVSHRPRRMPLRAMERT